MRNKQVQLLYGISVIQVLGMAGMAAGERLAGALIAVGTAMMFVDATGILIRMGKEKICPKCKTSIPKKSRICPECGYRYNDGISEDKLTEYIEQEKEKEMTSECELPVRSITQPANN